MALNLSRLSILLVEDDQYMRQLLRTVLAGLGVRDSRVAGDGEDGLAAVSSWQPDIIFADWQMSPMDGLEFTRRIRKHDNLTLRYVPIIMVSSHTTVQRITLARDAGITEFLAKPISPAAVYSRIAISVQKPREFVQVGDYFGPDRRRKVEEMAGDERRRVEENYATDADEQATGQKAPGENAPTNADAAG